MKDSRTKFHPHTGFPIVPLGRRKDGRLIWPIIGAAEDDSVGDDEGSTETDIDESDSDESGEGESTDESDSGDAEEGDDEEDKPLGDKGQQALDRMKAKVKAERAKRVAAEKALAEKDDSDDGKESEVLARANARIVKSEVKAAAAGKLIDPTDAFTNIDLEQFEVDEDGNVDEDEIAEAIDDLIKKKPYLAVQDGRKFKGSADGGVRKGTKKSLDAQIAEATEAGDFQKVIALKQQRAAELKDKK